MKPGSLKNLWVALLTIAGMLIGVPAAQGNVDSPISHGSIQTYVFPFYSIFDRPPMKVIAEPGEAPGTEIKSISVMMSEFPYDQGWTEIAATKAPTLEISPRRLLSARFRFIVRTENGEKLRTKVQTYVDPEAHLPTISRRKSVVTRTTWRMPTALLRRWNQLNPRLRSRYVYGRCGGDSTYTLLGETRPSVAESGSRTRITWPKVGLSSVPCSGRLRFKLVGPGKLPGSLANGDSGIGRRQMTTAAWKRHAHLIGKPQIPARSIKFLPSERIEFASR